MRALWPHDRNRQNFSGVNMIKPFSEIKDPHSINFENGSWSWGFDGSSGYLVTNSDPNDPDSNEVRYEIPKWAVTIITNIRDQEIRNLKMKLKSLDKKRQELLQDD